jgi:uridylate kinase
LTTDYPDVQRAVEVGADALLVAKNGVDAVYSADPRLDPHAERVTDQAAFILAKEHRLPLHVFDVEKTGVMTAIINGESVATEVSPPTSARSRR